MSQFVMMAISVLVADAQRLVADALRRALSHFKDLEVADGLPTSAAEAADAILALRPNVALLDYWLPDMEGPVLTRRVLAGEASCKVLLTSWFHGPAQIEEAIRAGAVGFLPKSLVVDQVVDAIRRAHAGESPVFGDALEALVATIGEREAFAAEVWGRLLALTPREIEVLQLLSNGRPFNAVASALSITPGTLRNHIHSILEKTGTGSQIEAVSLASRHGLIQA